MGESLSDFETRLIEEAAKSIAQSSVLASSIASRLVENKELTEKLVALIDPDRVAEAVAQEIIRKRTTGTFAGSGLGTTLQHIEDKTASLLYTQMQNDAMNIH